MAREAPNFLLITIDCLRSDHLGCYGYSKDTTPNIDRLASKGALFLQAISNGGQTPFAFPSILASALPPINRSELDAPLRSKVTIAELLKQNGYFTAAVRDNPYLTNFYSYHRGFDISSDSTKQPSLKGARAQIERKWLVSHPDSIVSRLISKLRPTLSPVLSLIQTRLYATADEITKKALSLPIGNTQKFFLWLHYMDSHIPYMPPVKYVRQICSRPVGHHQRRALYQKQLKAPHKISPSEVETIINLYDASIRYVDDTIGQLLHNLGDDLHNTIVIITADHGDEFGEHGRFSHWTLYDGVIHVPLIIAGAGIKPGTIVREQVSLLDLAPTLADFARIESSADFHGKSLLPMVSGAKSPLTAAISTMLCSSSGEEPSEYLRQGHKRLDSKPGQRLLAYRTPSWKYIRAETADASETTLAEELYYLPDDPGETNNLHGANIKEAKRFELEAKNKLSQFKELKIKEKTEREKERVKSRLKKLDRL